MHHFEIAHWKKDKRRYTHPFEWGIEHIGGDPAHDDPKEFLLRYSKNTLANSDEFFATGPAPRYKLDGEHLRYSSAIESPYPENNTAGGRWFPAEKAKGRAVIVLPQWNSQPESQVGICRWLNRVNLSALRLSLPYHDYRRPDKFERADPLVSPNVGLTVQANRQSVLDVRRAIRWLEMQGYDRIGLVGTSIGSCIGFIVMAHEPALRVAAFLHVSTQFGDVVRTGMTTEHVWRGIEPHINADELREIWRSISPFDYIPRLSDNRHKMLLISAMHDLSFVPEVSCKLWQEMDRHGIEHERMMLPCGHYTLGAFPFSWMAGLRFIPFMHKHLSNGEPAPTADLEADFE
jgi:hypothetical protein